MSYYKYFALLIILLVSANAIGQHSLDVEKADKYFELKDFDSAERIYTSVLKEEPNSSHCLWRLGDINWLNYDYNQAYVYYGIASGIDWKSNEHIRRYIEVLILKGEYENANKWASNLSLKEANLGAYMQRKIEFSKKHHADKGSYVVESHESNSVNSDFGACYIAENYFVYSSARNDIKRVFKPKSAQEWAGHSLNQLFVAPSLTEKATVEPLFYRTDLENNFNEGPIGVSGDGNWVAVTKNNFLDGVSQIYIPDVEMSLYLGILDEKGTWRALRPFEHNVQGFATGMASLDEEANTIYFSSNRPDGFGGFDIYESKKIDGQWSYPQNLGPAINTPGNEVSPFVDNGKLYFSSDLHPGYGGMDVYRTDLTPNFKDMKVYHLGANINSKYDDLYFSYNEESQEGFLTSNRNIATKEDVYLVKGLGKRMKIKVINASTGFNISDANINFKDCSIGELRTDKQGETSFQVLNDVNCTLLIGKDGYGLIELPFSSKTQDYWEIALYESDRLINSASQVTDESDKALEKVYVKYTNKTTGIYLESVSDIKGMFEMSLKPNTPYSVELMKPGYKPTQLQINSDARAQANIPVVTLVKQKSESPSIKANKSVITSNMPITDGYAVQLGSFEEISSDNMSSFAQLDDLGKIYSRQEGQLNKVRLGIYKDKETAENIIKIINKRGFSEVFIVSEGKDITDSKMAQGGSDAKSNETMTNSNFYVRLGAYTQPKWFDREAAEKIGDLETLIKGEYSIFLISNLKTESIARQVLKDSKAAGFKDALIQIKNEAGELVKLQ